MSPSAFKAWRERMGLTQDEAASALGVSRRAVIYFEQGERNVSRTVSLLCAALEQLPRKRWPKHSPISGPETT
jgi:transcriptional regulator with XRE-family HTH domain